MVTSAPLNRENKNYKSNPHFTGLLLSQLSPGLHKNRIAQENSSTKSTSCGLKKETWGTGAALPCLLAVACCISSWSWVEWARCHFFLEKQLTPQTDNWFSTTWLVPVHPLQVSVPAVHSQHRMLCAISYNSLSLPAQLWYLYPI